MEGDGVGDGGVIKERKENVDLTIC